MLAGTRRSNKLNGLGYSPQQNYSKSLVASTRKNHAQSYFNKHHAPNRYCRYRANHAGVSYNAVGMTRARYEKINNRSDYTTLHDTQNVYRRFKYGITIQPKDFKAMWVPKSQPIRLKAIWVPKTSPWFRRIVLTAHILNGFLTAAVQDIWVDRSSSSTIWLNKMVRSSLAITPKQEL